MVLPDEKILGKNDDFEGFGINMDEDDDSFYEKKQGD